MKLKINILIINKMSFNDLKIEDYTDRSVAVMGDTRKYKEDLKKLGGKYNGNLKNGPGWVFPKTSENALKNFIKGGKRLVTEEEAKTGEELSQQRSREWTERTGHASRTDSREKKSANISPTVSVSSVGNSVPTLTEYGALINIMKTMSAKVASLEHAMFMLLSEEQKEKLVVLMKPKEEPKTVVKKTIVRKIVTKKTDSDNSSSDDDDDDGGAIPKRRLMR
jgi:hypothetical protein